MSALRSIASHFRWKLDCWRSHRFVDRPRKPFSFRKRLAIYLGVFAAVIAANEAYKFGNDYAFMINQTESLPNWAFVVEKKPEIKRGDLVFFIPNKTDLLVSYFDEDMPAFGKKAFGLPGDVVSHLDGDVFVNGEKVTTTKPFTKTGLPLETGPVGKVPDGCYFLATTHPDGFDSRYSDIGFVCRRSVLGVGRAIL